MQNLLKLIIAVFFVTNINCADSQEASTDSDNKKTFTNRAFTTQDIEYIIENASPNITEIHFVNCVIEQDDFTKICQSKSQWVIVEGNHRPYEILEPTDTPRFKVTSTNSKIGDVIADGFNIELVTFYEGRKYT